MSKRCTRAPFGVHEVESDSSSKTYQATIREDGTHTCNCTGFVTKRNKFGGYSALGNPEINCKHIARLLAWATCDWNSETGEATLDSKVCPECDSLTEDYFTAPAVIDDAAVEEAIAGILATRDRMRR